MIKTQTFNELLKNEIEKFNPYHDRYGRFSSANGAASFTFRTKDPAKQHMANMAIEREKQRTGGAGAEVETESPRMKALHDVENKIRSQNFESAAVIDGDGNQLFFKDGQHSEVRFSRLECMQMNNNTLTHNHPRCSMFSPEDLNCMIMNNMYEIRATNRDGTTYSMRRADGGFVASKAVDFVGAYANEYPKSHKYAQADLDSRGFAAKIFNGEITHEEANIEFGRATAKYMAEYAERTAPEYGLVFTIEHSSPMKKSLRGKIMKNTIEKDDVMVLDRETNNADDKAFKEWLDKHGIAQE